MLATEPIRWPLEALWQAIEPHLPGFTCEVLPVIDSSNSELMRRFKAGRPEPTLLVAEQQSAGRGRLGRQWHGLRGDSLMFSLGMPLAPADWSGLSLAVGVSLADSLDAANAPGHRIALKWPNDLWLVAAQPRISHERKLGGILVETATFDGQRYVVIGVGINVRAVSLTGQGSAATPVTSQAADEAARLAAISAAAPAGAPPAAPAAASAAITYTSAATSPATPAATSAATSAATPGSVPPACLQDLLADADVASTLLRMLPPLVQTVQAFAQFGFAPFQARFTRRDVLSSRDVELFDGQNRISGQAHGVTPSGALLVHTAAGMKEITSSEVSVRPANGRAPAAALRPC